MIPTRRIPIILEAVELCPNAAGRLMPEWTKQTAGKGRYSLKHAFWRMLLCCAICLSAGESLAQQNWLVRLRSGTSPQRTSPPVTQSPTISTPTPGKPQNTEIKGAFGFTLGERVNPKFKLYHDSHEEDLPYYKVNPEMTLTENISIDYKVLLTPTDRRVALIKAKCILASFNEVRSFSQRIQELIFSKYGKGNQHILPTKFGNKWFFSKPRHPNVFICIEADSTTGIVYIQYSDETLVSKIRREVLEKRVGKLNISAL